MIRAAGGYRRALNKRVVLTAEDYHRYLAVQWLLLSELARDNYHALAERFLRSAEDYNRALAEQIACSMLPEVTTVLLPSAWTVLPKMTTALVKRVLRAVG